MIILQYYNFGNYILFDPFLYGNDIAMFTHKKSYNHFCHYGYYYKNGKYLRNVHLIYHNLVWFM